MKIIIFFSAIACIFMVVFCRKTTISERPLMTEINEKPIAIKKVEIYTTKTCPYCDRAKRLLTKKGVAYHEIDVSNDPDTRQAMTDRANGRRTVPQIFIANESIGGCDDLHELDAKGALDTLLKGE